MKNFIFESLFDLIKFLTFLFSLKNLKPLCLSNEIYDTKQMLKRKEVMFEVNDKDVDFKSYITDYKI